MVLISFYRKGKWGSKKVEYPAGVVRGIKGRELGSWVWAGWLQSWDPPAPISSDHRNASVCREVQFLQFVEDQILVAVVPLCIVLFTGEKKIRRGRLKIVYQYNTTPHQYYINFSIWHWEISPSEFSVNFMHIFMFPTKFKGPVSGWQCSSVARALVECAHERPGFHSYHRPKWPQQRVLAMSAASGLPCLRLALLLRNLACDWCIPVKLHQQIWAHTMAWFALDDTGKSLPLTLGSHWACP